MIVATRNRLIHGYLGIDNDIVWSLVRGTPSRFDGIAGLDADRHGVCALTRLVYEHWL